MSEQKITPNPNPEQLVRDIYDQLSSFRSASEQLADQAALNKITADGWKSLTINFSKTAEGTRKGIEDVVKSSAAAVEISKTAQSDLKKLMAQIQEIKLAKRLESLDQDQKDMLKHILELRTKHLERLESVEQSVIAMRKQQKAIEGKLVGLILLLALSVVILGIRVYGLV